MAEVLLAMLDELQITLKLLTIIGDNARNNKTLCDTLYTELQKTYNDEDD